MKNFEIKMQIKNVFEVAMFAGVLILTIIAGIDDKISWYTWGMIFAIIIQSFQLAKSFYKETDKQEEI